MPMPDPFAQRPWTDFLVHGQDPLRPGDGDDPLQTWHAALAGIGRIPGQADPAFDPGGVLPPLPSGAFAPLPGFADTGAILLDLSEPVEFHASMAALQAAAMPAAAVAAPPVASHASGRDRSLYNIDISFQGDWTAALQQAFIQAAQVFESIIRDDLPNVMAPIAAGTLLVDDITITATLTGIDGPGGALGQAGPTAIRNASYLPALGAMTFDAADAGLLLGLSATMAANGQTLVETQWDAVVRHEMLHALGFGSLWPLKGLVWESSYVGAGAALAYARMLDPAATGAAAVPLEVVGGTGTVGSHWSESVFGTELMTGYLNPSYAPLSAMSAHALADLGYGLHPESDWKVDPFLLA
jgi:hypothetical protein